MYTLLIRILINFNKEQYELINTNEPAQFYSEGKITRTGLGHLLNEESLAHYTIEQIQDSECVRVFLTENIKTIKL